MNAKTVAAFECSVATASSITVYSRAAQAMAEADFTVAFVMGSHIAGQRYAERIGYRFITGVSRATRCAFGSSATAATGISTSIVARRVPRFPALIPPL